MRYSLLEPLQANDNLAALFNAYFERLSSSVIVFTPGLSMGEFHRLYIAPPVGLTKPEKKEAKHLLRAMPEFYHLHVLAHALHDLHRHVTRAIDLLTALFNDHGGDLNRYAIESRQRIIAEYGSDDDHDWYRDNEADESEPWKVVYKDDPASLALYTLAADLEEHFVGADGRGEYIGSSQPHDFARFTLQVERASDLDPLKFLSERSGHDIPLYRQNDAGEFVPMSLGERAEGQLNDELENVRLAAWFRQIIAAVHHAATLHARATTTDQYRELLTQLLQVRDCQGLTEPVAPFNQ